MPVASDATVMLLLAAPIAHVRSITVMNDLLAARGANTVVIPAHVEPDGLPDVVQALRRMRNAAGAAVTMPHKGTIGSLLDELTDRARRCGSCNVVRREPDGRLVGDSTDGLGLVADLRAHGIDPAGSAVLVDGAGGAGRSVAAALARAGASQVFLRARRGEQARAAAVLLDDARVVALGPDEQPPMAVSLAVNCTPVGLDGAGMAPIDVDTLRARATVYDIVMTNGPTPLLSAAVRRGLTAISGHGMMREQLELNLSFAGAW